MREYVLVILVTAAVTYMLIPLVRRVAVGTRAIHAPRSRDTHTEPTPLLGGLAMYGGLVAGLIVASRLTTEARPGSVLVDRLAAAALLPDSSYQLIPLRSREVRGYRHLRPHLCRILIRRQGAWLGHCPETAAPHPGQAADS